MAVSSEFVRMVRKAQHDIDPIFGTCHRCGDTDATAWARGYFLPCGTIPKARNPTPDVPASLRRE